MKSLSFYINENKTLSDSSVFNDQDIIRMETLFAKLLVGNTFEVSYKCSATNFISNDTIEFNPMGKEVNHVIAHMIESMLNPDAILKYANEKSDKLDLTKDGIELEIKTSYKDLTDGKTPNNQKLYFSSYSQYFNLKQKNTLLLYIYYELSQDLKATIKRVYLRPGNMIEATAREKLDKESQISLRKPTEMCITRLQPLTKGNGEV